MAPTLVRAPFHRSGWVYEEKVDGWRPLAYRDGARVRLVSRNGVDHTKRFRDIAAAITKLSARTLVLDGEVAIYDRQLRSRFDWLREPDPDAVATPPLYMALDLVYRDSRDLSARPLRDRRAGWRTSSLAASWCSRCGGSRAMAWTRGRSDRARLRGVRREGRGQRVRGRAYQALAQGEAEGMDGRGGPLAAADQRIDNVIAIRSQTLRLPVLVGSGAAAVLGGLTCLR